MSVLKKLFRHRENSVCKWVILSCMHKYGWKTEFQSPTFQSLMSKILFQKVSLGALSSFCIFFLLFYPIMKRRILRISIVLLQLQCSNIANLIIEATNSYYLIGFIHHYNSGEWIYQIYLICKILKYLTTFFKKYRKNPNQKNKTNQPTKKNQKNKTKQKKTLVK